MLLLILDKLNDLVWTGIFLPCVLLCGLLLSLRSRFLQLRLFPASLRQLTKGGRGDGVSPVQAASTARVNCVAVRLFSVTMASLWRDE